MIGVFDSGFGGLTVHRALIEALPGRDFVYLGDNRNAPYGVRPPIDVLNLTCAALERLFAEGCTLAVVACNTASTVALRWIQQQWLPVRRRDDGIARNVIGIVGAGVEQAAVEKDLEIIRSQLDDFEFGAFSAQGRTMTMEQAIEYALEGSTSP